MSKGTVRVSGEWRHSDDHYEPLSEVPSWPPFQYPQFVGQRERSVWHPTFTDSTVERDVDVSDVARMPNDMAREGERGVLSFWNRQRPASGLRYAPNSIPAGVDQTAVTIPHDCRNHLPDTEEVLSGRGW